MRPGGRVGVVLAGRSACRRAGERHRSLAHAIGVEGTARDAHSIRVRGRERRAHTNFGSDRSDGAHGRRNDVTGRHEVERASTASWPRALRDRWRCARERVGGVIDSDPSSAAATAAEAAVSTLRRDHPVTGDRGGINPERSAGAPRVNIIIGAARASIRSDGPVHGKCPGNGELRRAAACATTVEAVTVAASGTQLGRRRRGVIRPATRAAARRSAHATMASTGPINSKWESKINSRSRSVLLGIAAGVQINQTA